jgi:Xaa-Pro dipeptidase
MPSKNRLDKLHRVLADNGLDAAVMIPGSNFRYLTGAVHYVMERPLMLIVPQNAKPAVIIPSLEVELFSSKGFDADLIVWKDAEGYQEAFEKAVSQLSLDGKRIGIEGQLVRFFESEALRQHAPNAELVDAHHQISSIRAQKESDEIESIRRAIQLSEQALESTLAEVKVGMTERQIYSILVRYMNEIGGHGLSFEPIVLAAENTARPHGKVRDDYALQEGDPLLFDFGVTYNGYPADITRTVFVGEPSEEHRALYNAVLQANETGRNYGAPGVPANDLDAKVHQALVDSGFEEYILHRTGHGLGLDVHEAPYISGDNSVPLAVGNVFTVEPGLYKAGSIGVRIEDNVVITEDGLESLTTFPRALRVIG